MACDMYVNVISAGCTDSTDKVSDESRFLDERSRFSFHAPSRSFE